MLSRERIVPVLLAAAGAFAVTWLAPTHVGWNDRGPAPRSRPMHPASRDAMPDAETAAALTKSSPGKAAMADSSLDSTAAADASGTTDPLPSPRPDAAILQNAVALYRKGDLAGGDAIAAAQTEPLLRTGLEWVALRTNPRDAGIARIFGFLDTHPGWPSAPWLVRRAEEALYADKSRPAASVIAFFTNEAPLGPLGKLALARALLVTGDEQKATVLVRDVWRGADLPPASEAAVLKEFGALLTAADDKYRAERLLYDGATAAGLRAAERVSADFLALARARAAVASGAAGAAALLDAVPASQRTEPGYLFARLQLLRRAGSLTDAVALLAGAPHDRALLVDGDAWWDERKLVARKLLDSGDAESAYRICAEHSAASPDSRVEAEFHAGWIALRFLDDPVRAARHFAAAAAAADTPASVARASYWQARTEEAAGRPQAAVPFYAKAAAQSASYYGQLARAKTGETFVPVRRADAASGDDRAEATRVVELLYGLRAPDLAQPLVLDSVQHLPDPAQVAAVGAVVAAYHDPRMTMIVGKLATNRGFALDDLAFPTFGVPAYDPVANSADRATVFAIARQESAFEPAVVSGAGARGLMQMLTSTARETAQRAGVPFDEARLTTDASFNAKLGAAFLGSLLDDERGSYVLTFAAYNAGGKRVQDWINAYGDPRDPNVDPIDWIELIPFSETRRYVQQVMENLEMYRLRFGEHTASLSDGDLRRAVSGL